MELGTGFAFMGQQYHLEVGEKDFYIDLLFYNTKLRCYVAIDLKTGEFKPEQAGKMNFIYLLLDDLVKAQRIIHQWDLFCAEMKIEQLQSMH